VAKVVHRKLGVALGEGQKRVQRCWLVRWHNSDSLGTAVSEQARPDSARHGAAEARWQC
jgi:hypothetical protein